MLKIVSIVGARPQFVKAAALSRVLRNRHKEILVHTGQHYDYEMSGIFFDGLDMPKPDVNLNIGSGLHGKQTGAMLEGIEKLLVEERPDWTLVYGDTNSTLAGSLAAAKLSIPVVHVEAGLRSYNRQMPEEINRVLADHVSELLLCPSETAVQNLAKEGLSKGVHMVGDVMLDVLNWAKQRMNGTKAATLNKFGVSDRRYLLATVHRSENTDDPSKLGAILQALCAVDETVILPLHPRARKALGDLQSPLGSNVHITSPVGYVEMLALTASARLVLTDSGGLQKEAYWLGTPCVTMRGETEWVETVAAGWNCLVGSRAETIVNAVRTFAPPAFRPQLYGDGLAANKCADLLR